MILLEISVEKYVKKNTKNTQNVVKMRPPHRPTLYFSLSLFNLGVFIQGKALEFYRDWNASWNQPWNYFARISSVDTSRLKPCSATAMSDDAAMRRHARITGDTDGVVVAGDSCCESIFFFALFSRERLSEGFF